MMNNILWAIYYIIIMRLPNSKYCLIFNKLRCFYLSNILRIVEKDKRTKIEKNVYFSPGLERVKVGKFCEINEDVFIQSALIGDYVMIAPGVSILDDQHNYDRIDIAMIMQGKTFKKKVVINNDVWIGRNAVIMPGVEIGKGVIVGAGAIVTRNIPPYSIVGGVPAMLIKKRN